MRIEDNTGLIFALQASERVIPAFIFTSEQIEDNPFRSDHCVKFMIESLKDLGNELKKKGGRLFLFHGNPEEIVERCRRELDVDALIVNRDYTPYSQRRDQKLQKICQASGIPFYSFDDALLHPPEETCKKDRKPYLIFTPYFRNGLKLPVLPPLKNREINYFFGSIPFATTELFFPAQLIENSSVGGRAAVVGILKKLTRDFPTGDCSTHLSPYLKFTICSPRELYAEICPDLPTHSALLRSLYWRDFFTSIAFFFPHVFEGPFNRKFNNLNWSNDESAYQRWCEGSTGFPLVDAGMREMNRTGLMPNRVRMITASFLIKDLQIDWRWGEKYFAQSLIDYDPAVNNGNWQWVAGTGCDAQPYFRIFNPWSQQKKFDPECTYIKKWIPELRKFSAQAIHRWYQEGCRAGSREYPAPMTDHEKAASKALDMYKSV